MVTNDYPVSSRLNQHRAPRRGVPRERGSATLTCGSRVDLPGSDDTTTRRQCLAAAGVAALVLPAAAAEARKRPQVAAIFTEFTCRSHAHVLLENFLGPYVFNGRRTDPGVDVVSFYRDQAPKGDMAEEVSRRYRVPIFKTIEQALCRGGKELAVDAVLSIECPRKRFFDATLESLTPFLGGYRTENVRSTRVRLP